MSLSAPLLQTEQQVSVIPNKVDSEGHHYLKVLLLSNKKTKNNWIAPYKRIGDLPKEVKESFLEVPGIPRHDHEYFDKLDSIYKNQGLSREERHKLLRKESQEIQGGYTDYLFDDDPNSPKLYGQYKVMDEAENAYIAKHKRPSTNVFTSPGLSGVYTEDENGTKVYDVNTIRAFHLAFVPVPAFDEEDAMIKGICMNGDSESCREALAYAGTDSPLENVNNTCGCNKSIMSANTPKVEKIADIPSDQGNIPTGDANTATVFKTQPKVEYKIETPVSDAPESEKKKAETPDIMRSQKEIDAENREKELQATIKVLQKKAEEQNNFYLEELLTTHIPRENFKKDEEYDGEKTNLKNFILKYNVSLEDAKWFIRKSVPKTVEVEKKKGDANQYAGYERRNTYNSDEVIKPASSAPTVSGSETGSASKETPILF